MGEYSRFDSSKIGGSTGTLNDFNRIDSYKLGSIGTNNPVDYNRIDSTKVGSSNGISNGDFVGTKNIPMFLNSKTPTELHS